MTDGQAIILYFAIFPIIAFIAVLVVDYIVDKYKTSREQMWSYRKQFKRMNEIIEKQEYIRQIKNVNAPTKSTFTKSIYINTMPTL